MKKDNKEEKETKKNLKDQKTNSDKRQWIYRCLEKCYKWYYICNNYTKQY